MNADLTSTVPLDPPRRGKLPGLFRLLLIAALVIGVALRFTNVAPKHKAVSRAEVAIALQALGKTPQEVRQALATGDPIPNSAVQQFQFRASGAPGSSSGSAMTLRRLTAGLMSLLALPLAYRLTRSHFPRGLTAIVLLSLLAVSPLQIAYAQEAQPTTLAFVLLLLNQLCLTRLVQFWQQRQAIAARRPAAAPQPSPESTAPPAPPSPQDYPEETQDRPETTSVRQGLYFCFYGIVYLLSAFGVAVCLTLFADVRGWLGVLVLGVSWGANLAIALALNASFRRAVYQKNPQLSQRSLRLWALVLAGAIALNSFHIMGFSGWLKGSANANLQIAELLQQNPAPIVMAPTRDADIWALLSLSYHLPEAALWRILPTERLEEISRRLEQAVERPLYLYRPTAELLEIFQGDDPGDAQKDTQNKGLIQTEQADLWRFG